MTTTASADRSDDFQRPSRFASRESRFGWQTEGVTQRAAADEENDVETASATLSKDELIRRATAERAAGRDGSSDVEALLRVAADENEAALDRLATEQSASRHGRRELSHAR